MFYLNKIKLKISKEIKRIKNQKTSVFRNEKVLYTGLNRNFFQANTLLDPISHKTSLYCNS